MIEKIKSRSFALQKEAIEWAKQEKELKGPNSGVKWETNRTDDPNTPWEAVLYRGVK